MVADLRLIGGDVSVDLLNTVDPDLPGADHLASDADVAAWLAHVGIGGAAALAEIRALRSCIDAVLRPLAAGRQPPSSALAALRDLEAGGIAEATLRPGGLEFADPLARLVHAAVELLVHGPVDRLRTCGNCPWVFLDLSRNGSRRWCAMETCGTEVKIRRLTERRRSGRAQVNRRR